MLLHMIRDAAFRGESVRPSIDSIIRRLVKVGDAVRGRTTLKRHCLSLNGEKTVFQGEKLKKQCTSIIKKIMEANGFRVLISSEEGIGPVMSLYLQGACTTSSS